MGVTTKTGILRVCLLAVFCLAFSLVEGAKTKNYSKQQAVHQQYSDLCQGQPTITKKHEASLQWLFQNIGESLIASTTTPQHKAACWMLQENPKATKIAPQRYVMAVIYFGTQGSKWDINTDWMTKKHECSWYGVECNLFGKVVNLDLGYIQVDGLVPREIGMLTELRDLDLHGNDLQGVIPHKLLTGLRKLEYLRLHMNGMFGALHPEITNMKNLKEIYLFGNYVAGTIPTELAQLKRLEVIDFYANQFEGTIPSELAKLPKLRYLDLHDNNLVGTMPKEICQKKLDLLVADCHGHNPEVKCDCCHICCQGLPEMICVDQKTGKLVDYIF
eukprot:Nitzschia sp. Nitz4//scaffold211_size37880//22789//23990//NITZ4_007709-RA/size37880-augustus-gene-0.55-mRNA-1//1//CDS//3329541988//2476//frame0